MRKAIKRKKTLPLVLENSGGRTNALALDIEANSLNLSKATVSFNPEKANHLKGWDAKLLAYVLSAQNMVAEPPQAKHPASSGLCVANGYSEVLNVFCARPRFIDLVHPFISCNNGVGRESSRRSDNRGLDR